MDYTLSTTNVTDVSFDIVITANVATTGTTRILALKVEDASAPGTGTNFMLTDTGMAQGATKTHPVGGGSGMVIDANTEYNISLKVNNVDVADPITVTTKATGYDTPRTATQDQWEDLADRVNARPIIGTVVSQPTAVAYVATANIVNGAVTPTKLDMASLIDIFYPVGCYFETSDTTFDPNVSWGGTWVEDSAGKVLISKDTGTFATVGDTGGSETHRHKVRLDQRVWFGVSGLEGTSNSKFVDDTGGTGTCSLVTSLFPSSSAQRNAALSSSNTSITHDGFGSKTEGNTHAGSTLPPYVVIKRWHRTA